MKARAKRWGEQLQRPAARRVLTWVQRLLTIAIVAFLLYQLSTVGWGAVLGALPTNPLFYLLLVASYLPVSVGELFIYRRLWGVSLRETWWPSLVKRVYNGEVVGYSGEAYFYLWARRYGVGSDGQILRDIRDVNIISSMASLAFAFALVPLLILNGHADLVRGLTRVGSGPWLFGGVGLALLVVVVVIVFRRHLFSMATRDAVVVSGITLARVLGGAALLMATWAVGVPGIPWGVWFVLLGVTVILTRIPFLPSQELLFAGIGVELADDMAIAQAALAGMLLVMGVGYKLLAVAIVALAHRYRPRTAEEGVSEREGSSIKLS